MNLTDETLQAVRQAATPGVAAGLWWAAQVRRGPGAEGLDMPQEDLDRLALVIQEEVDLLVAAELVPYQGVYLEMDYREKGLLADWTDRAELPRHLVFGYKTDMWVRPFEISVRVGGYRSPAEIIWRRSEQGG